MTLRHTQVLNHCLLQYVYRVTTLVLFIWFMLDLGNRRHSRILASGWLNTHPTVGETGLYFSSGSCSELGLFYLLLCSLGKRSWGLGRKRQGYIFKKYLNFVLSSETVQLSIPVKRKTPSFYFSPDLERTVQLSQELWRLGVKRTRCKLPLSAPARTDAIRRMTAPQHWNTGLQAWEVVLRSGSGKTQCQTLS